MRRSKLGLAFMVMLALTAIGAATAAAETLPNVLPLGSETSPLVSQSKSGASTFGSGLEEITSTGSTGTSSDTGEKLGTFHTHYTGVKSLALGQCSSTGDEAGVVLGLGQIAVKDAKEEGALIVAIEFLSEQVHMTCGGVPVVIEGCVAAKIANGTELTSTLTMEFAVTGGDNRIITVLNRAGTAEETCQLLSSVNGGATVLSSLAQTVTGEKFEKEAKSVQVLVMPL